MDPLCNHHRYGIYTLFPATISKINNYIAIHTSAKFRARKNYRNSCVKIFVKSFHLILLRSSPRPISIGQLHVTVFTPPTYRPCCLQGVLLAYAMGYLILKRVSRLDAFSVYLNRTPLLCRATGVTTDAQLVRSSRSSRTKDKPSQVSYAHDG